MKTTFSDAGPLAVQADLVALGVSDDLDLSSLGDLAAHVKALAKARTFKATAGNTLEIPTLGNAAAATLLLVGLGDSTSADLSAAAGAATLYARKHGLGTVAFSFGDLDGSTLQAVAEMAEVGNYQYGKYLPEDRRTGAIAELILCCAKPADADMRLAAASTRATWQHKARDLVNAPAADLYPESFADEARKLASIPGVEVTVWDFEKCRQEGLVGIIAVGQGSTKPGVLIHMTYRPQNAKDHIALVGKGVTFDAGGLSLKPSNAMQTMRCDMGGAATAFGAFGAIAELGLPIAVDCFIPSVENMCAANSFKLGDILRYNNGVTVEIHNTDAEGRLILADALIKACATEGVTKVVDMATLTGAVVVAIGPDFTGLFTKDEELASQLTAAADDAHELFWRMPLHSGYNRMLKGEWGQIKNVGGREAGSITAALFLEHFTTDDVQWAHLDIAGTAFLDKADGPYVSGGTGQVVRTLTNWAEGLAS